MTSPAQARDGARTQLLDQAVLLALKRHYPRNGGGFCRKRAKASILDGQLPPGFRGAVLKAWDQITSKREAA